MTQRELDTWAAYRAKFGPLSPVRMYDAGPAIIAAQINRAHGGKATPYDYMPYGKEPEPEIDLTDETTLAVLTRGGQARIGR